MWTIYALVDPRTSQICYVGQTQNHPEIRLDGHLHKRDENQHKTRWLDDLRSLSIKPNVVVLEYAASLNEALEAEREWIRRGIRAGWPLTNIDKPRRQRRALRGESVVPKISKVPIPPSNNLGKWYDYILEYMSRPEGAGLWKTPAQGVRDLARVMSVEETGNEASEDAYVGIASKVAKRIRAEATLSGGSPSGLDITHGGAA